jgi:uncharacterized repeat protein (TIGR02543 family)
VDVSPNDGGTVEVDQSAPSSYPDTSAFNSGANVSLEAVPAPGYVFSNWSGDLSNETNPATILMNCNKNIRANFSKTGYALNIQVNGSGSTTPEAGSSDYSEGRQVTITATPAHGWQFGGWTGDVTESSSSKTIVIINSAKTVTANFVQITHTLKVEINGGGSVKHRPSTNAHQEGTVVEVIPSPDSGWQFDGWAGDVADSKSSIIMVTMDSDKTIIANFSKQTKWYALVPAAFGGILILSLIVVLIKRLRTH